MTKWINIKDKLPLEDNQHVLALNSKGNVWESFYLERFMIFSDREKIGEYTNITHWIPYPEFD